MYTIKISLTFDEFQQHAAQLTAITKIQECLSKNFEPYFPLTKKNKINHQFNLMQKPSIKNSSRKKM